jgi:hypothetical protein
MKILRQAKQAILSNWLLVFIGNVSAHVATDRTAGSATSPA